MKRVREKNLKGRRRSGAQKGRKVANPEIYGSGGSKNKLAKAAGAEPAGQISDKKLHAIVPQSTFPSQNVPNTSAPEHF